MGEFQYEVTGIPEYPNPIIELRSQLVTTDMPEALDVILPLQNTLMNKARLLVEQKTNGSKHFELMVRPARISD